MDLGTTEVTLLLLSFG